MIDLERLSVEELNRLASDAKKRIVAAQSAAKNEVLRASVIEAVEKAPAHLLPSVLAVLRSGKKRIKSGSSKEKAVYKWDDAIGKNRKVNADGSFVEPPVLMRGRFAANPVR